MFEDCSGALASLHAVLQQHFYTLTDLSDSTSCKKVAKLVRELCQFPYCKVLIYSCQAYKDTRHEVLRETWIKDLARYGISYNIVVGGVDVDYIEDDIMALAVGDTYEELPLKTLRMFEYASHTSNHAYYYKIDDDCVLNVLDMFGDPAYLGCDYFGRISTGSLIDRKWHQAKSKSDKAKSALDLSPETSGYCDGSTGYILNRESIRKLGEVASLQSSAQLVSASYCEDKLVGDLLSLANIKPTGTGYRTTVKRNVAGGRDVQIWDYGLIPGSDVPVKVFHTEDDETRLNVGLGLHLKNTSLPALIYRDSIDHMKPEWLGVEGLSPILEILKVDEWAIRKSRVVAIIVGKNESELFPGLLAHHRKLGVEHFLYVDNCSRDESLGYMLEQSDVSVFVASQDYRFSRFGVNWQETLCSHYCVGKWTLLIDSDELFVFDDFENRSIGDLVSQLEMSGANAVLSPMVDFYPKGHLDAAVLPQDESSFFDVCDYFDDISTMRIQGLPEYGPFSNSMVFSGGMRERIFGKYNLYPAPNYLNQKYNFIRYNPEMRFVEGLHFIDGCVVFDQKCAIMHFKYHSGFHRKVVREVEAGQHWNGAKEYKRYMKMLGSGALNQIYSSECSRKYHGSSSLVESGYMDKVFTTTD
nr:glycosyltransferase family 2 protein [Oceanobacter mangrovi]